MGIAEAQCLALKNVVFDSTFFRARQQKKSHFNLIFSEKRLQRDKRRLKQSIHYLKI
jgi:hypothetical protein